VNVKLPPELEALVHRLVDCGQYDSPSQVLEDALYLLEEREQGRTLRKERLVRELASGLLQADNHQLISGSEVFAGLDKQPRRASE
jgi:putative addiction module CopG family antidote